MKLNPHSPNELLSKVYQCQANADELDIIIGHLNALQAELIDSFGTMGNHLEVDRLEIAVSRLTESAEHYAVCFISTTGITYAHWPRLKVGRPPSIRG